METNRSPLFFVDSGPLTRAFCIPGGPQNMIEQNAKSPVQYSLESSVVEERFLHRVNQDYGLFYRTVEARQVK